MGWVEFCTINMSTCVMKCPSRFAPGLCRFMLVAVLVVSLCACGFQMRGAHSLPAMMQQTVYVSGSRDLLHELERHFRMAAATIVRGDGAAGETRLRVTGETMERRVLSVDNTGKVTEYELLYVLNFDVLDGQGRQLVKPGRMTITRDYLFVAADVHGASRQEARLRREMRQEMSNLMMRRIQASFR